MTDLLTARPRAASTTGPGSRPGAGGRSLWLGAGLAGAAAAGSMLTCCMAFALVGWFASDAGGHGDTRDALRVGADAWLLSLGSPLELASATVSVVPLGLTALGLYVAFRLGRWAALTSVCDDLATAGGGTVVFAALHAAVALLTAVLATVPTGQMSPGRAFVGGLLLGGMGGGLGILGGSGLGRRVGGRLPETARAVALGGVSAAFLLLAAGSLLVVAALAVDLGSGANVLARLHAKAPGAALYTVVVAGFAPNASLFGVAYLLGPGFAVGTGTMVSTGGAQLGPVPAFPLLAALPDPGPAPAWTTALVAVPVLVAALAVVLVQRRHPTVGYDVGVMRGLGAGVAGGLLTGTLVALAGGSVGPGRMADVGAPVAGTFSAAVVAMGVGGALGGLAVVALSRRQRSRGARTPYERGAGPDAEDTVRL